MIGLSQDQHDRLKNSEYLEFRLLATRWRFIVAPAMLVMRAVAMAAYLCMTPLLIVAAICCGIFDAVMTIPGLISPSLRVKWVMLKKMIKCFLPIIVGK